MCVTNDAHLNDRMRVLRDHGMNKSKRYWHDEVGYNYRMTNLQASIGVAQLERVEQIIADRKTVEKKYKEALAAFPFVRWQADVPERSRVVWLVCLELIGADREKLFLALNKHGVDVRPFFYPLSDMDVYKKYVHSSGVSKSVSDRGLNLPTINEINYDKVVAAFKEIS